VSSEQWPDIGEKLDKEWEPFLTELRQEGFEVRVTSLLAPLQIEGELPTGEGLHFPLRVGRGSSQHRRRDYVAATEVYVLEGLGRPEAGWVSLPVYRMGWEGTETG